MKNVYILALLYFVTNDQFFHIFAVFLKISLKLVILMLVFNV